MTYSASSACKIYWPHRAIPELNELSKNGCQLSLETSEDFVESQHKIIIYMKSSLPFLHEVLRDPKLTDL